MFPLGFLSSISFRLGRIFYWLHNHIGVDSILPVEQDRLQSLLPSFTYSLLGIMKYIPFSLTDSTTTMNATTAPTDLNLLPLDPRRDTGNGTNTASAAPSNSNTSSMASAASTQPTMMSRNGIALIPAASPARPASTQTSKLAAKSDSDTATTASPTVSHTPEYAEEAGVFYDLTRNIEQGSIALPPAAKDEIHKWSSGTATERQTWRLEKLAAVHARVRGELDRFLRRMPVLALRGFGSVADTVITQAGLTANQVENVVLPVPSEDYIKGFSFTLHWMCSIIYPKDCAFVKMPYINTLPTYRNFRVAQNALVVGMTDIMQRMLGRINDL